MRVNSITDTFVFPPPKPPKTLMGSARLVPGSRYIGAAAAAQRTDIIRSLLTSNYCSSCGSVARERAGEVYSNIPCLFAPLPVRQRLAVSFIFRAPILRSIPGHPIAVSRLHNGTCAVSHAPISTLSRSFKFKISWNNTDVFKLLRI